MDETVQTPQQCGFTGAARAEHHQEFPGSHRKADVMQHRPLAVSFGEVSHFDHFVLPERAFFELRFFEQLISFYSGRD
jgi:hypothetical protein